MNTYGIPMKIGIGPTPTLYLQANGIDALEQELHKLPEAVLDRLNLEGVYLHDHDHNPIVTLPPPTLDDLRQRSCRCDVGSGQ